MYLKIDEKSLWNNNIHPTRINRRPKTTGFSFSVSVSHLHFHCCWKSSHYPLTLMSSHLKKKNTHVLFPSNFSILEIIFTTVCVPRFLYSMTTGDKRVSYNACAIQLFFVILIGATEFFLLTCHVLWPHVHLQAPAPHHHREWRGLHHSGPLPGWLG